jgi:hypothetical protein
VVREVHSDAKSRDMLKPENMALCSPRVFWAVLRHGNQLLNVDADLEVDRNDSSSSGSGGSGGSSSSGSSGGAGSTASIGLDLPASLAQLLPDLDWRFLRERARARSAKALENDRQAARLVDDDDQEDDDDVKMADGEVGGESSAEVSLVGDDNQGANKPAAAAAAATVSPVAAAAAASPRVPSARERALAAAELRQKAQQTQSKEVPSTDNSGNQELASTTNAPPTTMSGGASVSSVGEAAAGSDVATGATVISIDIEKDEDVVDSITAVVGHRWAALCAAQLPSLLSSHDLIAALADQTDPALLAARLRESIAATAASPSSSSSLSSAAVAAASTPSESDVTQWIKTARNREATRAMHAIVRGTIQDEEDLRQVHRRNLLVKQLAANKVCTVRDLALWAKRPSLLRNMLAKHSAKSSSSSSSFNGTDGISPEGLLPKDDAIVMEWASSAQGMMDARPWMESWSTKV